VRLAPHEAVEVEIEVRLSPPFEPAQSYRGALEVLAAGRSPHTLPLLVDVKRSPPARKAGAPLGFGRARPDEPVLHLRSASSCGRPIC